MRDQANQPESPRPGRSRRTPALWATVLRRLILDLFLATLALAVTLFSLSAPGVQWRLPEILFTVWLPLMAVTVVGHVVLRVYRVSARYAGLPDYLRAAGLAAVASVAVAGSLGYGPSGDQLVRPSAAPLVFFLLYVTLWAVARGSVRAWTYAAGRGSGSRAGARKVLIVGAGDAGYVVLRELSRMNSKRPDVVGFVDDDPHKHGTTILSVPVLGPIADVPRIAARTGIDEIMIAIPSASGADMRRIFELCAPANVTMRTLPSFEALVSSRGHYLDKMRDFQVEDLLRREHHADEKNLPADYVSGETVLITGGGGSIGSELARQVVPFAPGSLVLLGKGENSVFESDLELKQRGFSIGVPIVCDVRDTASLRRVFERHQPGVVFHAAAHKHVPLMETVPIEAIRNNVFGTLAVAEEAINHGVKKFILVSTDKAVNPKNVMGATKRVAEMIVTSLAHRSETGFSVVRFGNVLGSRGSLVPILQRQIKAGGPITITHTEMTRYFMTIPEAAQLVVQAGAMGDRGEIFILDMGDPVKIVDLAHDMVRMHGLVPGEDIEIRVTGIRPGEKLHEELAYAAEDLSPSPHPKIRKVVNERPLDWDWLSQQLEALKALCDKGDVEAARAFLMELAWAKNIPPMAVVQLRATDDGAENVLHAHHDDLRT